MIGVSVGLISIVAFTIMLLVLCGFKFCKHSSGEYVMQVNNTDILQNLHIGS